jgi:pimeloyl-ACP methyl ester carboxylesterase
MDTSRVLLLASAFLALSCSGPSDPQKLPLKVDPKPLAEPAFGDPQALLAAEPSEHCGASNIYRIPVPQYPDRAGSPTFQYAFQVLWGTYGIYSPVVIYLTGGPGFTSIGNFGKEGAGGVPDRYTVILVDQRGTGCSSAPEDVTYPYEFYTTEYMAEDVIALIKALKLTNYYLHGISFGTVHGTVVASLLERRGLTPPKGLILQGVVGQAYRGTEEINGYYAREWARVKPLVDPVVLQELSTSEHPYGYDLQRWRNYLNELLYYGDYPGSGSLVPMLLNPLASSDPATVEAAKTKLQADMGFFESEKRKNTMIYTAVACRELFAPYRPWYFRDGEFIVDGPEICPLLGAPEYTRPYDSANYPVTVPIYYFIGSNDPSTPPEQGGAHFDKQVRAKRQMVTVRNAGHFPLSFNLAYGGCTGSIWDTIVYAPDLLPWALSTCKVPLDYRSAAAGAP